MNLSSNKLINLGIVAAIVLVALGGWFLGISPLNDQVSAARATEQTIATANATSAARLVVLKKQFADMGLLQSQLDELATSVPAQAAVPSFLAEINGLTSASGAALINLTVSDAAVYVAPASAAAGTAAAATATGATATPAPADSSAATPAANGAAPAAGATSRLIVIPIRVTVGGSYAAVMGFAAALQSGPRLLLVSDLALTQSPTDGSFTGIIDGSIYALPPAGGAAATATTDPTPTQTPAPSTTPTPSSSVPAKPSGSATPTPTPTGTAKP